MTSTSVKCIECAKWSPKRASVEWARQGFGCCARREPFIVFGGEMLRDCAHHAAAEEVDVQTRRAFVAKQESKR